METVKLNGTTIQGGGLKYAVTPQIVLGDIKNGFEPGTILDANAQGSTVEKVQLSGTTSTVTQLQPSSSLYMPTISSIYQGQASDTIMNGYNNIISTKIGAIGGKYNIFFGSGLISGANNILTGFGIGPIKILKRETIDGKPATTLDLKATSDVGVRMLANNVAVLTNLRYDEATDRIIYKQVDNNLSRNTDADVGPDGNIRLRNILLRDIHYDTTITHVICTLSVIVGNYNINGGAANTIKGSYNTVWGSKLDVEGWSNAVFGIDCKVSASASISAGTGLQVDNYNQITFGAFNAITKTTGTEAEKKKLPLGDVRKTATLFAIGNGIDANNRSNALEIKYNGDMYLNDGRKVQDVLPIQPAATRPTNPVLGQMFFDTVKNKPLWFGKDNKWVDANGTVVA